MSDELRYWAVLFIRNGKGTCQVAVTDGDYTPHDRATVRKITEAAHGKVDKMSAVGPMHTRALAMGYINSVIKGGDDALDKWIANAE